MAMFICAQCGRTSAQCDCVKGKWLAMTKANLLRVANALAVKRERHSLTERDKLFLQSLRVRWE